MEVRKGGRERKGRGREGGAAALTCTGTGSFDDDVAYASRVTFKAPCTVIMTTRMLSTIKIETVMGTRVTREAARSGQQRVGIRR
jgi:hypothetical protein